MQAQSPPSCLLLVQPPSAPHGDLEALLAPLGFPLLRVASAGEAARPFESHDCALVLVDAREGGFDADAWSAILGASERNPQTPVLLLTGVDPTPGIAAGQRLAPRAVDCLPAPVSPELLRTRVRFLFDLDRRERAVRPREVAAQRLHESEEQFRVFFDLTAVGMAQLDPATGRFVHVNARLCEMLGYSAGELLARRFSDLTHPEDRDLDRQAFLRTVSGEDPLYVAEKRYVRADGRELWVNVTANVIRDAEGQARRTVAVIQDITERVAAEVRQRETEALAFQAAARADSERRLLDAILEAAPAGIIVADVQGRLVRMNPANQRLWGAAPYAQGVEEYREWKGWWADGTARHGQRLAPQDWAMARALSGETVTGDIVSIEPFDAPDTRRIMMNAAAPVRDAAGHIVGGVVAQADITDLKASEARFRTLTETIPQMIWTALPDGTIDDCNSRWRDYTGLSLEQTREQGREAVLHPDDVGSAMALWAHSRQTGEPYETEYRLRRARDGVYRWHLGRAMPLRDESGHVVKWFGTCTDIDEHKRARARLEQAQQEIRELNQGLEQRVVERTARMQEAMHELESFSYSVSHDLRAPLRHILGFAQLLNKRAGASLDAKSRDYMRVISDAAQRGGQLVDDLLAFSRMGRAELKKAPVDLGRLVDDVRRELSPEAEGRQVTWKVGPLPEVQGDPALLHAALKNLLANALKYTRPRAEAIIEVTARQVEGELELTLQDNGVGFEMQYVDKLFGVFQRLHSTEQFEGTGIGLANVRRIVQRHGGRVWAEGRPDEGATFYLTLPRTPPPGEARTPAPLLPG